MEGVEANIVNARQLVYDNNTPEQICFSVFGNDDNMDDPPLSYGVK